MSKKKRRIFYKFTTRLKVEREAGKRVERSRGGYVDIRDIRIVNGGKKGDESVGFGCLSAAGDRLLVSKQGVIIMR